jgi:hypothetical protein
VQFQSVRSAIDDFANVEPVLEQMGKRSHAKADAAPDASIGKTVGLGPNAAAIEVLARCAAIAQPRSCSAAGERASESA